MNLLHLNLKASIEEIFKTRFLGKVTFIEDCGNHELNRNHVYKVYSDQESGPYIVKFFYKSEKHVREIEALKYYTPKTLKILHYGTMPFGVDWIIYNFIEGQLSDFEIATMSMADKKKVFFEIGEEMYRLHQTKHFDYFGDWYDEKRSPVASYVSFMQMEADRIVGKIKEQALPQKEILDRACAILLEEKKNIAPIDCGRLCHRDLDGRNILVHHVGNDPFHLAAFLDFEKCVVFNSDFDLIGLFRKYFFDEPYLLESFFMGYQKDEVLDERFYKAFKFNLYKVGLDICSWTYHYSVGYFYEGLTFLEKLLAVEGTVFIEDLESQIRQSTLE